jgi:hypothetical protein
LIAVPAVDMLVGDNTNKSGKHKKMFNKIVTFTLIKASICGNSWNLNI